MRHDHAAAALSLASDYPVCKFEIRFLAAGGSPPEAAIGYRSHQGVWEERVGLRAEQLSPSEAGRDRRRIRLLGNEVVDPLAHRRDALDRQQSAAGTYLSKWSRSCRYAYLLQRGIRKSTNPRLVELGLQCLLLS